MPHSNQEAAIPWAEGELVLCCREMTGVTGPMVSLRVWSLPSGVQQSGGSCVLM